MVHDRTNHDGWPHVHYAVVGACKPAFFDSKKDAVEYAFDEDKKLKEAGYPHHSIFVEWRAK